MTRFECFATFVIRCYPKIISEEMRPAIRNKSCPRNCFKMMSFPIYRVRLNLIVYYKYIEIYLYKQSFIGLNKNYVSKSLSFT